MIKINENYTKLADSYLFSTIAQKVALYKKENPDKEVISLGIGDVTQPLCGAVISALHLAVEEMANKSTFRGYAPECGYDFLKNAIQRQDYDNRGVTIGLNEIFINDGAKSSLGHFCDILSSDNIIAISDPVYPVYVDTNIMDGRAGNLLDNGKWSKIQYLNCTQESNFTPQIPDSNVDVIYLCSPNNPTGSVMNREQLTAWVEYAKAKNAIILFDSAYEAFISDKNIPHSIYEIEGAKDVAIEFRSFSKTAGFTGVRCGYTIVPENILIKTASEKEFSLNALWRRHQTTRFNGTSYIIQKAAEAVYSDLGQKETKATIAYYMNNAHNILSGLSKAGYTVFGGENAPYIWLKVPQGLTSWQFFDKLLNEYQIVGTPGIGFGPAGEGYFRLTAFAEKENVEKALERLGCHVV